MKRVDIKKYPLSDTTLASLEPEQKEYPELDGNGLYFRVKADGNKSWQLLMCANKNGDFNLVN